MRRAVVTCSIGAFLLSTVSALDQFVFGSFAKTATYAVAVQESLFVKHGLNVTYSQVPNSTFAYTALFAGQYDLLLGALDNALNRRWNLGLPLSVVGQQDLGNDFVLQATPDVTAISQLNGKSIMVDSPVSGYSYALQRILALNGLNMDAGDYTMTTVGGSDIRYNTLLDGTYDGSAVYATMMMAPFTAYGNALTANRPNILARVSDYLNPYSSSGFTVTTSAAASEQSRGKIVRFLAAMLEANHFLSDPANVNASTAALATAFNITDSMATAEYAAFTDPLTGETTSSQAQNGGFEVSRVGALNVIGTRVQFDGWKANVSRGFNFSDAITPTRGGVIDLSLRDEAVRLLQQS